MPAFTSTSKQRAIMPAIWRSACAGLLLLALANPSLATGSGLHTAEVPLAGRGDQALQAAFSEALGTVLVRVTGRRDAASNPAVRSAAGTPAALVQQYQLLDGGRVRVQFDPQALRNRLDAADQPVWGDARPVTLVWLVMEDATGALELLDAGTGFARPMQLAPATGDRADGAEGAARQDEPGDAAAALRELLTEAAARRGVPLILPILDFQDVSLVDPAELREDRLAGVEQASLRYAPDVILIGRVQLATPLAGAPARWTLLIADQRLDWQGDAREGPEGLADRLAERYAGTRSGLQPLRLLVSGVDSFDGWGRLNAYLGSLGIIEHHALEQVAGHSFVIRLSVRGDSERLARTLAMRRVLEPAPTATLPPGVPEADLVYRLSGWR